MAEKLEVKELDQVVVRFSGDSGDGIQLDMSHIMQPYLSHRDILVRSRLHSPIQRYGI
jgi:hypothetical protein